MSTPLRIADEIYVTAQAEAELTGRSVTGQVEHWAKLGMAVVGLSVRSPEADGGGQPLLWEVLRAQEAHGAERRMTFG